MSNKIIASSVKAADAVDNNRIFKKKRRKKFHVSPLGVIQFIVIGSYVFLLCYLIFWVFLSSLKTKVDFNLHPMSFPSVFKWSNYKEVFTNLYVELQVVGVGVTRVYLPKLFLNSILYAVGCTLVTTISHAIVAYVVAKYKFWLRNVIYTAAIVVMIIPVVNSLPSELSIMRAIGFYDNMLALIFMKCTFTGMNFLILHATFSGISNEYAEAAKMDGAGNFTIMVRIMFPMGSSALFILGLTSFISYWNDWSSTVVYMPSYPIASYALYLFQNSNVNEIAIGGTPWVLTACAIIILPTLLLFILFRNKFMGDLSLGGIKG